MLSRFAVFVCLILEKKNIDCNVYFLYYFILFYFIVFCVQKGAVGYKLFAFIVHISFRGAHAGHYVCFVRDANNQWLCIDDNKVGLFVTLAVQNLGINQLTKFFSFFCLVFWRLSADHAREQRRCHATTSICIVLCEEFAQPTAELDWRCSSHHISNASKEIQEEEDKGRCSW
jgi:hypothetical protein